MAPKHKHTDLKSSAYRIVARCLKIGAIKRQPCAICGKPDAESHHWDYSRPLDIEWLCHKHHMEMHVCMNRNIEWGEHKEQHRFMGRVMDDQPEGDSSM